MESSLSLTPVSPVSPVAPYIGGKRNLAQRICTLIDAVPHVTYAEPFVGMGGIFFRRAWRPRAEFINDRSRDVATLFRILQRLYPQFMQFMQFQLTTRAEFERLIATNSDTLLDMERAARFLYLQRTAFGGKVNGRTFGVAPDRSARFDITKLGSILEEVHTRLAGVTIECLPFQEFITRYDRKGTLFYLDPPYFGCEKDYGDGVFSRSDFMLLEEVLRGVKGRFILSINDKAEVRRIFRRFIIRPIKTTYSVGGGAKSRPAGELIITNFESV
ncbi:DNA adenine methylase [Ferrovibrio sp.]|uniref:DNA adenine methylase n=1 Tax=Ferrovibrio sp. TaxID=1917215 RepID=UPI0035B0F10C